MATDAVALKRRKEPTMKKSSITIRHENKTIEVSKSFYKKASTFGTPECCALSEAQKTFPTYTVAIKSSTKKTYNGLSFERMEDYIKTQPNSEANLMKFEAVKRIAKSKNSLYPLTKKWFLHTFPAYKENEVSNIEMMVLTAADQAAAEAESEIAAILCAEKDVA